MTRIEQLLELSARQRPESIATIDGDETVSYGELWRRSQAIADALRERGLMEGEVVAVMAPDGAGFIVLAFAAVSCGAVVMPVALGLSDDEFDRMMNEAGVNVTLRQVEAGEHEEDCFPLIAGAKGLFDRRREPGESTARRLCPDAAFIRFTSGTTGEARGVVLSRRAIIERTAAANHPDGGLALTPEDRVLWVLPMAYHFFVSIVLYLRYGATIIIQRDPLPQSLLQTANRQRASLLYASPLHIRWLAADESGEPLETLKRAVATSTRLDPAVASRFFNRYGLPVTQAYGIIEVGLPMINIAGARERPESVGRPLPDYEVALLDEALRPVAPGKLGQLAVRGPGMFDAYLNPPTRREEVLREGWFLTGDLARKNEDDTITIAGRLKSMINVGGQKVFPEEVQDALNRHPSVKGSRVYGAPHPMLGEIPEAELVIRGRYHEGLEEEIRDFCRRHLSSFKVPNAIRFVDDIELTASGKVKAVTSDSG